MADKKKFVMTKGKAKELHKIVRQVPVKKASTTRPARKVPLDYANKKKSTSPGPHGSMTVMKTITTTPITKKQFEGSVSLKRHSYIGLGRTKKGRTPKSPGVPFERGSIGLRKKTRTSKSQVGSATGEKRELKRQTKKRQSNRGSTRR